MREIIESSIPEPNSGCWLWLKAVDRLGYGLVNRKRTGHGLAHRFSFALAYGSCAGRYVLHRCDNPSCVNPLHLEAGSPAKNSSDMVLRGRSLRGSRCVAAKLNEEQVRLVREMRKAGRYLHDIAVEFGVSRGAIQHICARKTWGHLP